MTNPVPLSNIGRFIHSIETIWDLDVVCPSQYIFELQNSHRLRLGKSHWDNIFIWYYHQTCVNISNQKQLVLDAVENIWELFITTRKRSCGKVMFSQASVCPWGKGDYASSWDRSHGRGTPWPSTLGTYPWDINPGDVPPPLLVTSDGDHWRPVQTSSFRDLSLLPRSDIWWWPLKLSTHKVSNGQYTFYWNAFLSLILRFFRGSGESKLEHVIALLYVCSSI